MLQIIQFHQTFGREAYDKFENKQCVIKRNEIDFTVDWKSNENCRLLHQNIANIIQLDRRQS